MNAYNFFFVSVTWCHMGNLWFLIACNHELKIEWVIKVVVFLFIYFGFQLSWRLISIEKTAMLYLFFNFNFQRNNYNMTMRTSTAENKYKIQVSLDIDCIFIALNALSKKFHKNIKFFFFLVFVVEQEKLFAKNT